MEKEDILFEDVIPFFYLNKYGVSKPIQAMLREDYKEPQKRVDLLEIAKEHRFGKSFVESLAEIGPDEGYADGFAYNSNNRLVIQRKRGTLKVVGPKEMYRYAGTKSMDLGWWNEDPKFDSSWKFVKRYPKPISDRTRYYDTMRKIHKFFNM